MLGRTVDAEKTVEREDRLESFQVSVSQSVRMISGWVGFGGTTGCGSKTLSKIFKYISARDASASENGILESDSMHLTRTRSWTPNF